MCFFAFLNFLLFSQLSAYSSEWKNTARKKLHERKTFQQRNTIHLSSHQHNTHFYVCLKFSPFLFVRLCIFLTNSQGLNLIFTVSEPLLVIFFSWIPQARTWFLMFLNFASRSVFVSFSHEFLKLAIVIISYKSIEMVISFKSLCPLFYHGLFF